MSWVDDIGHMHFKYGTHKWVDESTPEQRKELMKLRMRMLTEEFAETMNAYLQGDEEEIIDGIIDLCVIGIGTLDICGINIERAWTEVHAANMDKEPGVKPGRPNPLGLPDLVKPAEWLAPDHSGNRGIMKEFL